MGQLLKDLDALDSRGNLGDWCFVEPNEYHGLIMFLRYPISDEEWFKWHDFPPNEDYPNRGDVVGIPLSGDKPPVWQWDGNRECPTVSPSINVIGRWHGYFRNGKIETLE